ncbi:heavy metal-responsive transcriptional regulator [Oleiagrimonas sp. C23AA]|uniref:heavy metal-responsive transcriptional regulator n=1 Tax=Oleiagrimonas sp. C23AA TaxID=2719047 RepID=UPI0014214FDA|nr:heavy metal-responsive transcriptional regulator [Oleiagrimonas sp. C23AA]NII09100.1 heavy metal-responsive transcriptional regulator [Oleiagrimonas sp. C23AA]
MKTTNETGFSIGTVARRAGVGVDTIRYYEREGLLPAPARRASGYRVYGDQAIEQLRFIRRAKELGFSLDEVRELMALSADRERGVTGVKQRAQQRLAAVEQRMAELERIRGGLQTLIDACPGHGDLDTCPILKALGSEEDA